MEKIINSKIVILGGTGSLGHALVDKYNLKELNNEIYIISRCEFKQFLMKEKYPNLKFLIGDIRDKNRMLQCLNEVNPHIILICSALKHIDICEENISECIKTNITGIQNVIDVTLENRYNNLNTVLFISTDKSCSPTSVYGMSKAISERIVIDAGKRLNSVNYLCVRYGNVLNSRGSIIPKFLEISKDPKYSFGITNDKMTRFFMSLDQSVELIDTALLKGNSGDTWIPIVPSFKIYDLAKIFSEKFNKNIYKIPLRPGEKLHECLINDTEAMRTDIVEYDNNKKYYIIRPCYKNYMALNPPEEYTSENVDKIEKLKEILEFYFQI
jgi:FlaA1/EpsC-like NDP-sugar epimerase